MMTQTLPRLCKQAFELQSAATLFPSNNSGAEGKRHSSLLERVSSAAAAELLRGGGAAAAPGFVYRGVCAVKRHVFFFDSTVNKQLIMSLISWYTCHLLCVKSHLGKTEAS